MKDAHARRDFMDATIALLQKAPLTQFNVKDIVSAAGYSRQSFYSHFLDKYDIVNQIYLEDLEALSDEFSEIDSCFDPSYQRAVYEYYQENQVFFKNCFLYLGQNSLFDCMRYYGYQLHNQEMKKVYGSSPIPPRARFELDYHISSLSNTTREYIMSGAKQSPEWMAAMSIQTLPQSLQEVYL